MNEVYQMALNFQNKYPGGIAWRIKKHCKVAQHFLNPQENVLFAFCVQKNEKFSEIFNTHVVVVTNKRLLIAKKRLLWGSFLHSITPDLYNDMQIYRGLIWGKVVIDTVKEKIILTNLPKSGLDAIETAISELMMEAKKKYHDKKSID